MKRNVCYDIGRFGDFHFDDVMPITPTSYGSALIPLPLKSSSQLRLYSILTSYRTNLTLQLTPGCDRAARPALFQPWFVNPPGPLQRA